MRRYCNGISLAVSETMAVFLGLAAHLHAGEHDKAVVKQIVANLRANEDLYKDIEVTYRVNFRSSQSLQKDDSVLPFTHKENEETYRSIVQGDKFFVATTETATTLEGKASKSRGFEAYDGGRTRRFSGGGGNIHHDRFEPVNLFRPHNLLYSQSMMWVPLSMVLQGGATLHTHPYASIYQHLEPKLALKKREIVDGVNTVLLRCEYWNNYDPAKLKLNSYEDLWLAPDRNYLPLKWIGYGPEAAGDPNAAPSGKGHSEDFREVKPGVWLAFSHKITSYDDKSTAEKLVLIGEWSITIEKVEINPNYPDAFFREVPFPVGTVVHEIKDGKRFKSYVEGRELEAEAPPEQSYRWLWWLAVNAVLIGVVVAIVVFRRRRKTRALANLAGESAP